MENSLEELTKIVTNLVDGENSESEADYKYVVYLRKSTDESGKQYRSLGDQKSECSELASSLGLNVVSVIEESESAKESGIRPKFEGMLKGINKGDYNAIIAWHPDRLARNMKDAGTIIDMLDRNIIKDIKFKSFSFEKNTSGKMLLGLAFVLSKEYSDKLSDNVKRGIKHSTIEGKIMSRAKHGYYKDGNKLLRPDGLNFILMRNAWNMRLDGKSLDDIAIYLNESNYARAVGAGNTEHKVQNMNKRRLSDIFRNPVYAGVLKVGKTVTNLVKTYGFTPLVSVEEFKTINRLDDIGKAFVLNLRANRGIVKANLLRGRVICGECGKRMSTGITTKKYENGKVTKYFLYRCNTKNCSFCNKSVRAKVIVNFAIDFLDEVRFTTKENYKHYVDEMKKVRNLKNQELLGVLDSFKKDLKIQKEAKEKIKNYIPEAIDNSIRREYEYDLKKKNQEIFKLEGKIKDMEEKIKNSEGLVISQNKFLELFNNLPKELKKRQKIDRLDAILKKIFSNFVVRDKKVCSFGLNSPFREFVIDKNVTISESKRT